jgi:hypothetical protein
MSIQDELTRQTNINLQLRRQLEACRREVVEKCAKFCEDHAAGYHPRAGWDLMPRTEKYGTHAGQAYAKGLRGLIGQ